MAESMSECLIRREREGGGNIEPRDISTFNYCEFERDYCQGKVSSQEVFLKHRNNST